MSRSSERFYDVRSDFYQVEFGAIPNPVYVNIEVESRAALSSCKEIEAAAFEIAFYEILDRGGPAGPSRVRHLMQAGGRPPNVLTHASFPGVHAWLSD